MRLARTSKAPRAWVLAGSEAGACSGVAAGSGGPMLSGPGVFAGA
ncbi:Unknown protein sequence [Pseudomonas amygdali pv. myricae]|nr:Unknown protein sequence [Pseudomonas amygdali pv. myricae]